MTNKEGTKIKSFNDFIVQIANVQWVYLSVMNLMLLTPFRLIKITRYIEKKVSL